MPDHDANVMRDWTPEQIDRLLATLHDEHRIQIQGARITPRLVYAAVAIEDDDRNGWFCEVGPDDALPEFSVSAVDALAASQQMVRELYARLCMIRDDMGRGSDA